MAKFNFKIKHNGVTYEPGEEVPVGQEPVRAVKEEIAKVKEEVKVEEPKKETKKEVKKSKEEKSELLEEIVKEK